jgi:DNA-binding winged helix-turn-helix (wHTH) protein
VHVRRLRAKLGPEHESLIGTVRNVGYRFVSPEKGDRGTEEAKLRSGGAQAAREEARADGAPRAEDVKTGAARPANT